MVIGLSFLRLLVDCSAEAASHSSDCVRDISWLLLGPFVLDQIWSCSSPQWVIRCNLAHFLHELTIIHNNTCNTLGRFRHFSLVSVAGNVFHALAYGWQGYAAMRANTVLSCQFEFVWCHPAIVTEIQLNRYRKTVGQIVMGAEILFSSWRLNLSHSLYELTIKHKYNYDTPWGFSWQPSSS